MNPHTHLIGIWATWEKRF